MEVETLRVGLAGLHVLASEPEFNLVMFNDNQGVVALTPVHHNALNHIKVRYHFCSRLCDQGKAQPREGLHDRQCNGRDDKESFKFQPTDFSRFGN